MRIIAGSLGGRQFTAPKGHHMRPMAEKVRGALFTALGDIEGLSVLDAYGGSGAVGLEAVSRGADQVQIVEIDKKTHRLIENNIKMLGARNVKASRASILGWLDTNNNVYFDIIVADPPFSEINQSSLNKLLAHLKPGGIMVVCHDSKVKLNLDAEQVKSKSYGDAGLSFFRTNK